MSFAAGTLVRARDREWVVLPESTQGLLVLRPLGGGDDEIAGVMPDLEPVIPAQFAWPDPTRAGDHASARLLRDAGRLGFRSSAGPFRSFGAIAVEPRPYQLVPLLMALRLGTVRLLIADDVGIGKTIEAALVAKELLVTGAAKKLAVLCPPHLAEQWQTELAEKFNIAAELVLTSTASRLERACAFGESLFQVHPYTIVSTDYIKADRRRDEFLRTAPDLVIVDEAHTCAVDGAGRGGRHQRHELLQGLASDPTRHLLLVTATPHSGNEGAFRSLIGLLEARFRDLPDEERIDDRTRAQLARHFIQRRRADIRRYLDTDTPFPERLELPEADGQYRLTAGYRRFVEKVLAWAKETVADASGGRHRQRVRWWGVLGLLRALASSPPAAAATLRNRAAPASTTTLEEADEAGRRSVLDQDDVDDAGRPDAVPGAEAEPEDDAEERAERRRLRALAAEADGLVGAQDAKLGHATALARRLVADGANVIMFCRFIPTAEYLAEHLRASLGPEVAVEAVTGLLPPAERESRVQALGQHPRRMLIATDCLSEGVNLQSSFDAVVHYDLPWNPTRLEQREGRVDRYGQRSPSVRIATIYGIDNVIDEIVLEVLLRKHRTIRSALGISIPVPGSNDEFMETVFDRLFHQEAEQLSLLGPEVREVQQNLFAAWDRAAEKERQSRTRFAQHAIGTEEVAAELAAVRAAIGSGTDVARFLRLAVPLLGGAISGDGATSGAPALRVGLAGLPQAARDLIGLDDDEIVARFEPTTAPGEVYLSRTHPLVEGIATYVLDTALDPLANGVAARCGVVRTGAVAATTTMLLVRYRFEVVVSHRSADTQRMLAEDLEVLAFEGSPAAPVWLPKDAAEALLSASADANIPQEQRVDFTRRVIDRAGDLSTHLATRARERAAELAEVHHRTRREAGATGRVSVTPHLPVDVLGTYLFLPV